MADHVFGDAAHQQINQAGASMRSHHNLVAPILLSDPTNDFSWRPGVKDAFDINVGQL
nr:hypothetical protein [Stieleria maiorica]